jgi:hypothetical protein
MSAYLPRFLIHLIRVAILAMAAVALLIWFWAPARGLVLFLFGRASTCTFSQFIRAVEATAPHVPASQRFRRTSRLVEKDAFGLELWGTEQGRFWIVSNADMDRFLAELAQQELNIYGTCALGVHPGDIVLDCGAHHGIYARKALRGASGWLWPLSLLRRAWNVSGAVSVRKLLGPHRRPSQGGLGQGRHPPPST